MPARECVMACLLFNELASYFIVARLSALRHGAAAKASLNRANESR